jgi:hypothetical protein
MPPTQRYAVTQPPIETLFTWIKSGEIAIPEIERPFVWDATKVRNFLDSLFQGYPVGFLIAWKNPDVRLKDGTSSSGKRILIDGQQRITALMASLEDARDAPLVAGFLEERQSFRVALEGSIEIPLMLEGFSKLVEDRGDAAFVFQGSR